MASRRPILLWLASAASAVAFWFGTGLHPLWCVTWLAPFFAFVAVGHGQRVRAGVIGFAVFFAGELNLWNYLSFLPRPVQLIILFVPAAAFAVCMILFNHYKQSGRFWLALLAPAAAWTCFEFGYSSLSPHGTFGAIAYTQSDCLVILQLASFGGIWPIGFIIVYVAAGAALSLSGAPGSYGRGKIFLATAVPLLAVVLFGWARLHAPAGVRSVNMGLVASDRPENMNFSAPESSLQILQRYLLQLPTLARAGAQIVVLPEHLFSMREAGPQPNATQVDQLLKVAAATNRVAIAVGVDRIDRDQVMYNEARLYLPDGYVTAYAKQHLLPGFEAMYRPGTTFVTAAYEGQNIGLGICKDLDFPEFGRAYAQRQAGLLLVPAFDFVADGWLHSRMAIVRGVESGFAVVRSAKKGALTVSDTRGRVLAETPSHASEYATLVTGCTVQPCETLYARRGDWFAWFSCALLAAALLAPRVTLSPVLGIGLFKPEND